MFYPAMQHGPWVAKAARTLFVNWMKRTSIEIDSGCIYISGAVSLMMTTSGPVRCAGRNQSDLARALTPGADCAKLGELRAVNEADCCLRSTA